MSICGDDSAALAAGCGSDAADAPDDSLIPEKKVARLFQAWAENGSADPEVYMDVKRVKCEVYGDADDPYDECYIDAEWWTDDVLSYGGGDLDNLSFIVEPDPNGPGHVIDWDGNGGIPDDLFDLVNDDDTVTKVPSS